MNLSDLSRALRSQDPDIRKAAIAEAVAGDPERAARMVSAMKGVVPDAAASGEALTVAGRAFFLLGPNKLDEVTAERIAAAILAPSANARSAVSAAAPPGPRDVPAGHRDDRPAPRVTPTDDVPEAAAWLMVPPPEDASRRDLSRWLTMRPLPFGLALTPPPGAVTPEEAMSLENDHATSPSSFLGRLPFPPRARAEWRVVGAGEALRESGSGIVSPSDEAALAIFANVLRDVADAGVRASGHLSRALDAGASPAVGDGLADALRGVAALLAAAEAEAPDAPRAEEVMPGSFAIVSGARADLTLVARHALVAHLTSGDDFASCLLDAAVIARYAPLPEAARAGVTDAVREMDEGGEAGVLNLTMRLAGREERSPSP